MIFPAFRIAEGKGFRLPERTCRHFRDRCEQMLVLSGSAEVSVEGSYLSTRSTRRSCRNIS